MCLRSEDNFYFDASSLSCSVPNPSSNQLAFQDINTKNPQFVCNGDYHSFYVFWQRYEGKNKQKTFTNVLISQKSVLVLFEGTTK